MLYDGHENSKFLFSSMSSDVVVCMISHFQSEVYLHGGTARGQEAEEPAEIQGSKSAFGRLCSNPWQDVAVLLQVE